MALDDRIAVLAKRRRELLATAERTMASVTEPIKNADVVHGRPADHAGSGVPNLTVRARNVAGKGSPRR